MSFNYTEIQCIIISINYLNRFLCQKDHKLRDKDGYKIKGQPLRKKPNNFWTSTGKIENNNDLICKFCNNFFKFVLNFIPYYIS